MISTKWNFGFLFILAAILLLLYTTYRTGLETLETNGREGTLRFAQFGEAETNTTETATEETLNSFIYLTQTEQCLPLNLSSSREIGDSKTCNCDVIVLSYKKECQEEKPSHISYIFARESTWTSGRNILYFVARERMRGYHYYIFLDDDVDLEFNSFTPPEIKMLSPFRAFEQWLLDNEPAVGVMDYGQGTREIFKRRRMICGINDTSLVVPIMWFDALFNAFHHMAITHILPYPAQYDNESWWTSQLHVIYSVELKFRGQALLYVPVTVHNRQHRHYPRGKENFKARVPAIVQAIQKRAPTVYQNSILFKESKTTTIQRYNRKTTTYCMNTTRHPIVPYLHFEHESGKT